ncbi:MULTISPECIES: GntR family transcriptional regulator [Klebsiella pneumoniae complex]|uniref:Transcriptional regulator, GntR family n=1 Tax=Klebsiella quasivariicola TaxID=2026240 RepID=A0A8B4TMW9_9ENTR|nr:MULTISPECIES: GntR family transcriptional regulator [Klebsiella]MDF2008812.1 GntR family transcriptional regulator [Klebsiella quasivariicola]MDK6604483.1 GntR family transcriptional regulator [Klebsiella quasivariicola]MDK7204885.1 GntR family transcriptional regulator [Klebsiella quasivariicola]NBZ76553.1 UTRA domain-containing protein [Klebsiella quasivariicola]PLK37498.1 GntR family transcriptional regulator [Klebsiella variicola]
MVDGITEKQKEVVDYILLKIKEDDLLPGDKLDTEIAIAKNLGITRATVREATRLLIEQQRIYRVKGSGLFVGSTGKSNHSGKFHALSPFDFQAKKSGHKGIRKIIKFGIIKVPTPEMAQALRIKNSDQVYKILRLMCFDDIPVALEHVHLPVNMFENMEVSELEFSKYSYIENITGKKVQRREQNLTAINITDDFVINCLKLEKNNAVMEIYETVYLDDGTPCEVNIAIINTNYFPLKQNSSRP